MMYNMVVERTKSGSYSAYLIDGAIFSGGKTFEELKKNMVEALNFGLDQQHITYADIKLTCDIQTFFEANPIINKAELASHIGMNKSLLAQYACGIKSPSAKQTARILAGIHKLGRELCEIKIG